MARAADPPPANFQSITGVTGYQYGVPSDWQQLPLSMQERVGSQSFADDGEVASADGQQHAHVETAAGFGITTSNLNDALTAFLTGTPNVFAGPGPVAPPASASGSGTNATSSGNGGSSNASAPSGPTLTVFAASSSVTVPGADAAVAGAASYTDPNGAARMALKGTTAYLLIIDSTKDFYQNNPALGQIETSFTLNGGTSTSAAATTDSSATAVPTPAATAP
jgi:hypothetical protein